jgi:cytochrome c2
MRIRIVFAALATVAACGCAASGANGGGTPQQRIAGADPEKGRADIQTFGCGSCHMIPGVRAADGLVGPPLIHWSRRTYIAGEVANTPDFLVRWIEVPQAIEPGTAMPNLGVPEGSAKDMAAYLYTLK